MTKGINQHTEQYLPDHADLQQEYEYSAVGTLAIDMYGVVHYVNSVALSYMEMDKHSIVGQSLFNFYSDADPDKLNEGKLMRLEEITDCEFELNRDQTATRWVLMSSKVHRTQNGAL